MDATIMRSIAAMFIAHIPATYILAKITTNKRLSIANLVTLSLGSIFPDIDLLRFYLLDNHQYHHHSYWTHRPSVWLGILLVTICVSALMKTKRTLTIYLFFLGVFLHMVLDTIVGEIAWLWPLTKRTWTPVHIMDTQQIWILNFFLHWTFAVEIIICLLALFIFWKNEMRDTLKLYKTTQQ